MIQFILWMSRVLPGGSLFLYRRPDIRYRGRYFLLDPEMQVSYGRSVPPETEFRPEC